MKVRALAGADLDISARAGFEHVGEVLAAHDCGGVRIDVRRDAPRGLHREPGLGLMVDHRRIALLPGDLGAAAEDRGGMGRDRFDPRLRMLAQLRIETAHGATQLDRLGDDVVGVGRGAKARHRDDKRMHRIGVARHDRLQRQHEMARYQGRIDRRMGSRRMASAADDTNGERVGRRIERAGPDGESAHGQARRIVHAVDLADAEAVDQAVVDHRLAAGAALLRRLEDHRRRAVEVARLGEIFGGAEQHRGVPVVAAGVHEARRLGRMREAGRLGDRQRVHVGADADHAAG